MAALSIRIDLAGGGRIGPGKIRLLEAINEQGSISAGGRKLGMSYRRAWVLVAELNAGFSQPVLDTSVGGKQGGGAALTDFGRLLISTYRDVEHRSYESCRELISVLEEVSSSVG